MNILILHRIPYPKIDYHRGIDHERHEVTYFGVKGSLATLPGALRCKAVERPGIASAFEEARQWLSENPRHFDRIISLSEYELLDAANLRGWLAVAGATVDQVRLARDKILMKEAVSRAGIRVPRFLSLPEFVASGGRVSWSADTVLKPHSGASSEDVVVLANPKTALSAIVSRCTGAARLDSGQSNLSEYEVEEFISGPILHFDGLVHEGTVLTITASEYVGNCLAFANGAPLGSYHYPLCNEERAWVQRALEATGIRNGSFHLEAIRHGFDMVFLEVANRVGGADVVRTFELATGVHLPSQELRILIGEYADLSCRTSSTGLWHGWFVYPGHHQKDRTHRGLDGVEFFRTSPSVIHWHELKTGASLPSHVTYQAHEVPLAGVIATTGAEKTREWIDRLFASVSCKTEILSCVAAEGS
ncbi:ATP-dependent carboxylate-amine ligase domain-containing protein [Caballeronia catudaia]|uniref:ATP-dependent carboxylate-amine ligase domain-containing protein n=1 Tax=Caballeronia catudaia TaxID=1777136 RepID=A0A158BQ46_9BURK|nr:ATP-grasp domain protein [Caballeronia catudaia]SAK72100.1 ATP-dependent carboxylate-amine ligase domain-containing protein [Caballeronia catudaia]